MHFLSKSNIELNYFEWILESKNKNLWILCLVSLSIHAAFFFLLAQMKPKKEFTSNEEGSGVRVNLVPSHKFTQAMPPTNIFPKQSAPAAQNRVLTAPNHQSQFTVPSRKLSTAREFRIESNSNPSKQRSIKDFLPSADDDFLQKLRSPSQQQEVLNGDGGDIPIQAPQRTPHNGPNVMQRFVQKDMGLFQFSKEFRDKFAFIWNKKERFVSPSSVLRPGDVVYYKVFVNPDGSLDHFENLNRHLNSQKVDPDIDKMFADVIHQVFPMVVPSRYVNANVVFSEVVAIQVIDRSSPIIFSF